MLLLIAPAALLLFLFQVVPIYIGANASFRDWALYNPKMTRVGLDHYIAVITDPAFLFVVLPNTFLFMMRIPVKADSVYVSRRTALR